MFELLRYLKARNSKSVGDHGSVDLNNHLSMMAITLNWNDENFEMFDILIGFRELFGDHTGENIASAFMEIVNRYELDEKVLKFESYSIFTLLLSPIMLISDFRH